MPSIIPSRTASNAELGKIKMDIKSAEAKEKEGEEKREMQLMGKSFEVDFATKKDLIAMRES